MYEKVISKYGMQDILVNHKDKGLLVFTAAFSEEDEETGEVRTFQVIVNLHDRNVSGTVVNKQ